VSEWRGKEKGATRGETGRAGAVDSRKHAAGRLQSLRPVSRRKECCLLLLLIHDMSQACSLSVLLVVTS